ncbi:restriction endonuclease subunit S [Erwinia sp. CPCC 100877]|nr:restriction endonuclease subunit S [Erwinia sp. CPCC 100877]
MSNNTQPEIRFPGFTEDWEERKLGEVTVKIGSGKTPKGGSAVYSEKGIPLLRSQNIYNDRVNFNDIVYITKGIDDSMANSHVLKDDVLLNITGASIGRSAVYSKEHLANVNQHVCIIRPGKNVNPFFIQLNITSPKGQKEIELNQAGGGREGLNFQQIARMTFFFPNKEEQAKIGTFFKQLDDTIALHQRKLDLLKETKKGFLQKMFPKNGAKVPEIRFPGFTENWEERKLSDEMTDFIVPMRDKPKEFGGNIPWTRIEDIEGKFLNDSLSEQYVTEETIQKMNLKIIPKDSLIVSSSATFGVVAVVTQDLITNQTFIGLVPREKNTLDYWYSFFQSSEARKYMKLQSAGSTIFYIARDSFEKMPISVPKIDEMIKIGEYFSNLDNLIALHQRKLDLLKETKKGFLQKMFV